MSITSADLSKDLQVLSPRTRSVLCSSAAILGAYVLVNGAFWCMNVLRGNINSPTTYLFALLLILPVNALATASGRRYWLVMGVAVAAFLALTVGLVLAAGGSRILVHHFWPQGLCLVAMPCLVLFVNALILRPIRRLSSLE